MSQKKKEEKDTQKEINEKKETSENQINDEKKEKTEENPCEEIEREINELREKLKKTEEIAKNLSLAYKRLEEEFENYKIRMRKEKEEAKDEGALRILKGFVEIIDNFEQALESAKTATDINAFIKGIQMIHYQLHKFLQDYGMEKVETSCEFNPIEHEAVEAIKTEEHQPNSIVKVVQTGYKYKGKVIRPAKVVVAIEAKEEKQKDEEKEN